MGKRKTKNRTADSTPEFICMECGYHVNNCVCSAQKPSVLAKKTKAMVQQATMVAEVSLNNVTF